MWLSTNDDRTDFEGVVVVDILFSGWDFEGVVVVDILFSGWDFERL